MTTAKKTKGPKSKTVAVRGVVERADVKERAPFDPYAGRYDTMPTERKELYLDVCLRLPDGSAVYFNSPCVGRWVVCAPGAAIVCFNFGAHGAEWFEEYATDGGPIKAVATPGESNNNAVRPKVRVGDEITVAGRVKADKVSKWGTRYKSLSHIFVPTPEGLAEFPADEKFGC